MAKLVIKKPYKPLAKTKQYQQYHYTQIQQRQQYGYPQPQNQEEFNCGCMCMFLGSFGPLGLIVAAIIGKAQGVKFALTGWGISWVIFGIIWSIIVFVSASM